MTYYTFLTKGLIKMADGKLCDFAEYKGEVAKQLFNIGAMLLGMKQSEITSKILLAEKAGYAFNAVFLYTAPNGVSYGSSDAVFHGWFEPYIKDFMDKAFSDPAAVSPFIFAGEIYKEVDKITVEWVGQE